MVEDLKEQLRGADYQYLLLAQNRAGRIGDATLRLKAMEKLGRMVSYVRFYRQAGDDRSIFDLTDSWKEQTQTIVEMPICRHPRIEIKKRRLSRRMVVGSRPNNFVDY